MSTETSTEPAILNISAYKFVALSDLETLRITLREQLISLELKGTILLSSEGINMFLAGEESAVREFLRFIRRFDTFSDLAAKESFSREQPFNRALVRLKKEIIAFGVDGIDPARNASPKISAQQLRDWLEQGKDLTLLDVRNDYEIELGTFAGAEAAGIDNFREFPDAVAKLPESMKDQPVVMFCTGGIRCEKAGPFMEQQGFREIYQLEGGILKYFEECGGDHYEGDCFVFDHRVSLDSALQETDTEMCFVCQQTLTPEQQQSENYVPGRSCPLCFNPPSQTMQALIDQRHESLAKVISPLPGSTPEDNFRPISVSEKCDGITLIDLLDRAHPHVGREKWQARCDEGFLLFEGAAVNADQVVRSGQRYQHLVPAEIEPDVDARIEILFEDDAIVAVNKPAPLPMHPSGRFKRNTLTSILSKLYQPVQLRIAHRLDANTTGVVVLSKSKAIAREIQPQFERGEVEKTYLARVLGDPPEDHFMYDQPISAAPAQAGLRTVSPQGQEAITQFEVLQREETTTLLRVTPKTGRTNQIRVHLWHLGFPIVGDPAYLPGKKLGESQTLHVSDPSKMCLHAWKLKFQLNATGEKLEVVAPAPSWARPASEQCD